MYLLRSWVSRVGRVVRGDIRGSVGACVVKEVPSREIFVAMPLSGPSLSQIVAVHCFYKWLTRTFLHPLNKHLQ